MALRIKLKYPDLESFIHKHAAHLSSHGIFIATRTPKPVGTALRFEFFLSDAAQSSVLRGAGEVTQVRQPTPEQPQLLPGMQVTFAELDAESRALVDRIVGITAAAAAAAAARETPSPADTRGNESVATERQRTVERLGAELDQLAADCGLSDERLAATLARHRQLPDSPTALDELLVTPPTPAVTTREEAQGGLGTLLDGRAAFAAASVSVAAKTR